MSERKFRISQSLYVCVCVCVCVCAGITVLLDARFLLVNIIVPPYSLPVFFSHCFLMLLGVIIWFFFKGKSCDIII